MRPYTVAISQAEIDDLRERLLRARWPEQNVPDDWDRGIPRRVLAELVDYWVDGYDWRAFEVKFNQLSQFTSTVLGSRVHFIHQRSPEPHAVPLLLLHGWPGGAMEFLDMIGPLTDPRAYGLDASTAFHVVVPSPPGFSFSGPHSDGGWGVERMASAWTNLMSRLGYDQFFVHGTDFGSWVSEAMAQRAPEKILGAHLNFVLGGPTGDDDPSEWPPESRRRLGLMGSYVTDGGAYMEIQGTRPRTLGYGLDDSPLALLAWIGEKMFAWTGSTSLVDLTMGRDRLLDVVNSYWFTGTGASATHWYYEMFDQLPVSPSGGGPAPPISVPTAVIAFDGDVCLPVAEASHRFTNLRQWTEYTGAGHFPGLESPVALTFDIRSFALLTQEMDSPVDERAE